MRSLESRVKFPHSFDAYVRSKKQGACDDVRLSFLVNAESTAHLEGDLPSVDSRPGPSISEFKL
jgi:hypothetical protein